MDQKNAVRNPNHPKKGDRIKVEPIKDLVTFKSCGTARKRSCFHDCKGSALSWLKHEQEGVMCENGPSTARRSTWGPPAAVEKTLPRSAFGA